MKTIITYYSYSGHTKKLATELAAKESADIHEIVEENRPARLKAYTSGILDVMREKSWAIKPTSIAWDEYDQIILMSPVWAGNPPPPIRAFIDTLPSGKAISVTMVAASGKADCREKLGSLINGKGSSMNEFKVVKA
ncbi:MAG: NAD(P)H-dependent oxidoreductase [Oscillospiraceae bacterium]|nr:NAD(P)H-dependent oxidoreductase [Oscillospiraceae bacterium]